MENNLKPIKLRGETHKKLKIIAAQEELTLIELVDKIIKNYVEDKEKCQL